MTDRAPEPFILIAHRGGLFYRPENTMAAFLNAARIGMRWAECDVRLSHDGVAVLCHGDRLSLPGEGSRAVRELEFSRLQQLDVGGGEPVPALAELFERLGDRLRFDIELKELDVVTEVARLVAKFGLQDRVILTSFIPEALQQARDTAPDLPRGLLVDQITGRLVERRRAVRAARLLGCRFLLPHHHTLTGDMARAVRDGGIRVIPWTVNRTADAERLLEIGIDGLVSDRPDIFMKLVKE